MKAYNAVWFVLALVLAAAPVTVLPAGTPDAAPLPLLQPIVHRPVQASDREWLDALPQAAVVIKSAPAGLPGLAAAFRAALQGPERIPPGGPAYVLAAGPMLDSPDQAEVSGLSLARRELRLDIVYTSARLLGIQLRRNQPWRPLAQIRLPDRVLHTRGVYTLVVTWRGARTLSDRRGLPGGLVRSRCRFEVV